jgi:hypothetical protein
MCALELLGVVSTGLQQIELVQIFHSLTDFPSTERGGYKCLTAKVHLSMSLCSLPVYSMCLEDIL